MFENTADVRRSGEMDEMFDAALFNDLANFTLAHQYGIERFADLSAQPIDFTGRQIKRKQFQQARSPRAMIAFNLRIEQLQQVVSMCSGQFSHTRYSSEQLKVLAAFADFVAHLPIV
ncbi:MAG: hypothetical protein ACK2UR_15700 [Candidatus Promineifilaceae bacterium]